MSQKDHDPEEVRLSHLPHLWASSCSHQPDFWIQLTARQWSGSTLKSCRSTPTLLLNQQPLWLLPLVPQQCVVPRLPHPPAALTPVHAVLSCISRFSTSPAPGCSVPNSPVTQFCSHEFWQTRAGTCLGLCPVLLICCLQSLPGPFLIYWPEMQ